MRLQPELFVTLLQERVFHQDFAETFGMWVDQLDTFAAAG